MNSMNPERSPISPSVLETSSLPIDLDASEILTVHDGEAVLRNLLDHSRYDEETKKRIGAMQISSQERNEDPYLDTVLKVKERIEELKMHIQ